MKRRKNKIAKYKIRNKSFETKRKDLNSTMDELLSRFPNIAEDVFENLRRLYSIPDKTMDFKKVKNAAKVAKKKEESEKHQQI